MLLNSLNNLTWMRIKKKTNNNTNFERNTFLRLNVKEIALKTF